MHKRYLYTAAAAFAFMASSLVSAHHGTSVSYDMNNPWTTEATVVEFIYSNPHPRLVFERTNDKGEVEHWDSELISNPSIMMRAGWNRTRSVEALKPGTKVTLTLSTSKSNPRSAVVRGIRNTAGEEIVMVGPGNPVAAPGQAGGERQ